MVPVIIVIVDLVLREVRPGSYVGGVDLLDATSGSVVIVSLVMAILIGAIAGAWDVQHGTLRYLALTGTPKRTLYWVRVPALAAVIALFAAPGTLARDRRPASDAAGRGTAPGCSRYGSAVWSIAATAWAYGLIALAVGALLTSSAAAIALSLALNFVGLPLFSLLDRVSKPVGDVMFPNAFARLVGDADDPALGRRGRRRRVGAFLVAGAVRTIRPSSDATRVARTHQVSAPGPAFRRSSGSGADNPGAWRQRTSLWRGPTSTGATVPSAGRRRSPSPRRWPRWRWMTPTLIAWLESGQRSDGSIGRWRAACSCDLTSMCAPAMCDPARVAAAAA